MTNGYFLQVANEFAADYGLDKFLVQAIIGKESSWMNWAWNPEPAYRYLWDVKKNEPFRVLTPDERTSEVPPLDFPSLPGVPRDAEFWGQQASWGLMQVMGAVARENGMLHPFLSILCSPIEGIRYGCITLAKFQRRFHGDIIKTVAAYNGGPGAALATPIPNYEAYVKPVLSMKEELECQKESVSKP